MPIGTAVHERTFQLCQSLNYREWTGYYTVSAYETHHEHEYNAIRNAAALIDVSPLFKYLVTGKDATRLVNRIITRDINKVTVDQVIYCCWCDEHGKVIDDGTIIPPRREHLPLDRRRSQLALVSAEFDRPRRSDRRHSPKTAALALQGPTSGRLLKKSGRGRHREPEIFPRHHPARSQAFRWTSPAPATPEIWAMKSGFHGTTRSKCGTR